ncbi:hypothetical protein J3A83DRAFT_4312000 [Scleroderma citrinum]
MATVRPATPLTPALSQWLRRSFAYTPELTSSNTLHSLHHHVNSQSLTEPRGSSNTAVGDNQGIASRLRPSTKRKRAKSISMSVSEDILPRLGQAKKSRRKSTGDAFHVQTIPECKGEPHSRGVHHHQLVQTEKSSSMGDTSSRTRCQTKGQGRRMVLDAVEIVKRDYVKRPSDVVVFPEGRKDDGTQTWNDTGSQSSVDPRAPMDNITHTLSRKRRRSSLSPSASTSKQPHRKRRRARSEVQNETPRNPRISRGKSAAPRLVVPTTPLKTSKYFDPPSVQVMSAVSAPPKSSKAAHNVVDFTHKSGTARPSTASGFYVASQEKYESLHADCVIMLEKLKPILVQGSIRDDPWKVLLAVRLLNVTTGRAAIPIFWKIMSRWPRPRELVDAPLDELVELLRPLGLYNKRAKWFKEISQRYMDDPPRYHNSCPHVPEQATSQRWCTCQSQPRTRTSSSYPHTPISHFPGVGPYALDSFRIFCWSTQESTMDEEWKQVMPSDKELIRYMRWKWAYEERKVWYPDGIGVVGDVDVPYLITLVDELAEHYDTTIGGEGYIDRFIDDVCSVDSPD